MAYCRINEDSDVYLYSTGPIIEPGDVIGESDPNSPNAQTWVCCGCSLEGANHNAALADEPAVIMHSAQHAIDHLLAHRAAGDRVPEYALTRLMDERLRDAPPEDAPISEAEEQAAIEAREALQRGEVVSHDEARRVLEIKDDDDGGGNAR